LNPAEKLNAISPELQHHLTETFTPADLDPATSVMLLRAEGRSFRAGYDLCTIEEGNMVQSTDRKHMRQYLKREMPQSRAYSAAVITQGGRSIWLAGVTALQDASGKSLVGDFDGQVREVFARIGHELEAVGSSLGDLVTMTVFITDARYGDRFVQLRKEILGDNFPASALITCAGLARPGLLVEIQAIAVADQPSG
jgi:2-iminobutanoate/2-iminopropanoate deaminase